MSSLPEKNPAPAPPLGMGSAVRAFLEGIGFIIGTPSIWGYAAVPALMMVVLTLIFGSAGIWAANRGSAAILGEVTTTWGHVADWVLTVLLAVVAVAIGVLLALTLAQPLSCFALERIVHAQERALTGRATAGPPLLVSMFMTLQISLLALFFGVPILVLLFAVNLVFPPAAVVTVPLKLLVVGWLLGWDFLDYPLGLRRIGLWARCRWVVSHFGAFTVYGVLWAIFVVVPGIVLLLLPMGVAGAAWMVVQEERANS